MEVEGLGCERTSYRSECKAEQRQRMAAQLILDRDKVVTKDGGLHSINAECKTIVEGEKIVV